MKNLTRLVSILLTLFLIYSCQNLDDSNKSSDPAHANSEFTPKLNITYEEITFDQYIREEAPETLIPLKNHLDLNINLKSGSETEEDFVILTDKIKKITKDGFATYTFMVGDNNQEDDVFENLVILKLESSYIYYKVKYKKNEENSEIPYNAEIKEISSENLDTEILFTFLKSGPLNCPVIICQPCSPTSDTYCHSPENLYWPDNSPAGKCSGNYNASTIYDYSGCTDSGGDDEGGDGPNTTTGSESGGGSPGGGSPTPNGPTTSPTDPGLEDTSEMDEFNENRIAALRLNLSSTQTTFLINNDNVYNDIVDFLNDYNVRDVRDLVATAINILINNITTDFNEAIGLLDTAFNVSALTNQQKTLFNDAIVNLKKNPIGAALLLSTTQANVAMGATLLGPGAYNALTNTIEFRTNNDINSVTLGAELFHAYQQQIYGILDDIMRDNRIGGSNIEFEEKAFNLQKDITDGTGFAIYPGEELLVEWLIELEINHPTGPIVLSTSELESWFVALNVFQQLHVGQGDHYGDPVDPNLKPDAIINLINRVLNSN